MKNLTLRFVVSLLLFSSFVATAFPISTAAQGSATSAAAAQAANYEKALAAIEAKVEARRSELGIPGMSLVIVKDDQIIYIKGLGYKDFENKVAVTPDTQFAIGSATKAFTALSALISQDEGKLSLDDSPKKALPYFKMYDPDTDKTITIRDLLCHSSGLNRTDIAMITGKLNRAELIQVAAQAKPTAKLREKFQYQNIMFAAAGEIVAKVQKKPWEKFVPERILGPLGMANTTMSLKQMEKAPDHSYGYDYNFDTKVTKRRPFRDIDQVAPAGSINSSARDMAQWLRFILNGGTVGGKRLVSEKGFDEWLKPQMKIDPAGTMNYGLGWFLQTWNGLKVVQHGGNIDGFNSLVAMVPEKKLGFVMLTNVSGSSLGNDIMPVIFSNIIDGPKDETKLPLKTLQLLAGKYGSPERSVEVKIEGEDLFIVVAGQPPYKLVRTAPRTFRLEGLPDGFTAKFGPETGDAQELEMIQPQGNVKMPRLAADGTKLPEKAPNAADPAQELIGTYVTEMGNVEIKETAGKVTFNISGQQPYTLVETGKDIYSMSPLPAETFSLKAKRGADGKVMSVEVTQPAGVFEFKRLSSDDRPKITVEELQKKALDAIGGEAAWRRLTSRVTEADIDLVHQGVRGKVTSWSKAPNLSAAETKLTALGKTIAKGWEYFDGSGGEEVYSFAPVEKYEGKRLDDVRLAADFYGPVDWSANYKKIEITGTKKIGDEDAYVVSFEPNAGTAFKEYYSTKSFLLLRREGVSASSTSQVQLPYTVNFSDYRDVDGVKLAFRSVNTTVTNGDIISTITSVKHNTAIDNKIFAPRKVN